MKFFSNKKLPASPVNSRHGFTLVEMIVALGIFSVVAVVALGALTKIISANKKAQTLQASITNLNFALDSMSREMRVGKNYYCSTGTSFTQIELLSPSNCAGISSDNTGATIAFTSSEFHSSGGNKCNLIYAYIFEKVSGTFILKKARQPDCMSQVGTFDSIIDPSVTITGYYIKVNYDSSSNPYPLATIRVTGYAGTREKEKTYFNVQTAVSSRLR